MEPVTTPAAPQAPRWSFLRRRAFWISLVVVLMVVAAVVFSTMRKKEVTCTKVSILIDSVQGGRFIHPIDVEKVLQKQGISLVGSRLLDIQPSEIESAIQEIKAVKNVEVITDADGGLKLEIQHRVPILRVFPENGKSYYVDYEGLLMPLSNRFSADVPVATGSIAARFDEKTDLSDTIGPNASKEIKVLKELFQLARFLASDPLWNAQVSQIFVDQEGEISIVPRVGSQMILIGNGKDLESKFDRLKALYTDVFSRIGWDTVQIINLKFKDQVICKTKQEPVIPVISLPDSLSKIAPVLALTDRKDAAVAEKAKKEAKTSEKKKVTGTSSKKTDAKKPEKGNNVQKPAASKAKTPQAKEKNGTGTTKKKQ